MSSFESIPWCAALLRKPEVVTFTPMARLHGSPSQDQLFKTSLNTASTVPEYLGFYQNPFSDPDRLTLPPPSSNQAGPQFLVNRVSLLIDLRPGVNGFNRTAHGGLIASLFDEAMGCLLFQNAVLLREMLAKGATIPDDILNLGQGRLDIYRQHERQVYQAINNAASGDSHSNSYQDRRAEIVNDL
ncbi:hypothetical protein F4802DRAFT_433508 [Xylaria palmicola]|nr:hypothetical protein F4802DRAFT_433508 [Xylaria palmicola]